MVCIVCECMVVCVCARERERGREREREREPQLKSSFYLIASAFSLQTHTHTHTAMVPVGWCTTQTFVTGIGILVVGVGAMYVVDPVGSMEIAEISLAAPAARTEIRAMYGGLHLALGAFLFSLVRRGGGAGATAAATLVALVFGCVGACRLLGAAVEGTVDPYNGVVTAVEFLLCGAAAHFSLSDY